MSEKMTPKRILEIYEDMLNRYEPYAADLENGVWLPYTEISGVIHMHLPPRQWKAGDEGWKGEFEPENVKEGTVIATVDADGWGWQVHVLDAADEDSIRVLVSQMLFPDGGAAYEFLDAQEF